MPTENALLKAVNRPNISIDELNSVLDKVYAQLRQLIDQHQISVIKAIEFLEDVDTDKNLKDKLIANSKPCSNFAEIVKLKFIEKQALAKIASNYLPHYEFQYFARLVDDAAKGEEQAIEKIVNTRRIVRTSEFPMLVKRVQDMRQHPSVGFFTKRKLAKLQQTLISHAIHRALFHPDEFSIYTIADIFSCELVSKEQAKEIFTKIRQLVESKQMIPQSYHLLAMCYQNKLGTDYNGPERLRLLHLAADMDFACSQSVLLNANIDDTTALPLSDDIYEKYKETIDQFIRLKVNIANSTIMRQNIPLVMKANFSRQKAEDCLREHTQPSKYIIGPSFFYAQYILMRTISGTQDEAMLTLRKSLLLNTHKNKRRTLQILLSKVKPGNNFFLNYQIAAYKKDLPKLNNLAAENAGLFLQMILRDQAYGLLGTDEIVEYLEILQKQHSDLDESLLETVYETKFDIALTSRLITEPTRQLILKELLQNKEYLSDQNKATLLYVYARSYHQALAKGLMSQKNHLPPLVTGMDPNKAADEHILMLEWFKKVAALYPSANKVLASAIHFYLLAAKNAKHSSDQKDLYTESIAEACDLIDSYIDKPVAYSKLLGTWFSKDDHPLCLEEPPEIKVYSYLFQNTQDRQNAKEHKTPTIVLPYHSKTFAN